MCKNKNNTNDYNNNNNKIYQSIVIKLIKLK